MPGFLTRWMERNGRVGAAQVCMKKASDCSLAC